MAQSTFSQSWYRVAALTPRLRLHVRVSRHRYRGQPWYVLQDSVTARYHRFTPSAYFVIGLMDGRRKLDTIWEAANTEFGDDAPTQDEVIQLLGQLHAGDVLQCEIPPDSMELFRRYEQDRLSKLTRRLVSPLSIRIPLFDPERMLEFLIPLVRPLFSWIGFIIWTLVVGVGIALVVSHWTDLTHNISDRVLNTDNLLLIWLSFPFIKLLHELGHALATKHWGGEVHEMGISLLVLTPVPYIDASASSAFPDKRKRIFVAAAGMMVELFIATLALFVWLNVENGLVSAAMFNIMLIGGVSTLFFNGNPLLRFDGYFMLADAIEIPNLGGRSTQYLGYLCQRYLFDVQSAESPVTADGERRWFVLYGIAAFIYRLIITFVIVLFIPTKFFIVGILLAEWAVLTQVLFPLGKQLKFLFVSPKIRRRRLRALGLTGRDTEKNDGYQMHYSMEDEGRADRFEDEMILTIPEDEVLDEVAAEEFADAAIEMTDEEKAERITRALQQALDSLGSDLDEAAESQFAREQIVMVVAHMGGVGLSAGVLAWLFRAGSLLASVLSAMPLWTRMDPLPVLLAKKRREEIEDDMDDDEKEAARILDGSSASESEEYT